jgi:zinc protease
MRPSSLTVVIVGDVEPSRAIDAARTAFGVWQGERTRPAALPDIAPRVGRTVRSTPMMSKSQAEIAYGFIAIRRADPQYYAYWVMNNVLGQYSLGGRLGDSIRERQGMAYHVFSTLDAGVIPGTLLVRAGVAAENVDRAIASIDAELEALAETGPTPDELAESRQYLVGSLPRHLETNPGIAAFLQQAEFFGLGLDYDLRIPDLLGTVTLEQVRAAARATLDPARATIVVAGPYAGPFR